MCHIFASFPIYTSAHKCYNIIYRRVVEEPYVGERRDQSRVLPSDGCQENPRRSRYQRLQQLREARLPGSDATGQLRLAPVGSKDGRRVPTAGPHEERGRGQEKECESAIETQDVPQSPRPAVFARARQRSHWDLADQVDFEDHLRSRLRKESEAR